MQNDKLDIAQILRRIPLFQELSQEQIEHLAAQTREKRLHKGEMLFQKGDQPRGFYAIVYGQMKLAFPSAAGNEKVVEILGPQQSFGEAVMFMDRPYPVFAESLADSCCCTSPARPSSTCWRPTPPSPAACWPGSPCACTA
jgi:CRP-like cAMP-binding protein